MPTRESWHNVGRRIRRLRKEHQLTIKQLAAGCGLSPNAISLLERGEVAPTVATLCKVAAALGVSASSLFQEVCPNEVVLTRAMEHCAPSPVERTVSALRCALEARESRAGASADEAQGDAPAYTAEYVLCLNGEIDYEADGQCYQLKSGDSLSFNGRVLHFWRNRGAGAAVAVMILYPEPK